MTLQPLCKRWRRSSRDTSPVCVRSLKDIFQRFPSAARPQPHVLPFRPIGVT